MGKYQFSYEEKITIIREHDYAIPSETILKFLSDAKKANAGIEI